MEFPPNKMIATLRADVFDRVMKAESVWMCISCYACAQVCPSKILLTTTLMTRAKEELLLAGNVPSELQQALLWATMPRRLAPIPHSVCRLMMLYGYGVAVEVGCILSMHGRLSNCSF